MGEANCCQQGLRAITSGKLGKCPRCIGLSLVGAVTGWTVFALLNVAWPNPILLIVGLVIALSFTLLMVSHLMILLIRVARVINGSRETLREALNWERREFLGTLFKVSGAVVGVGLLDVLGRTISHAQEQPILEEDLTPDEIRAEIARKSALTLAKVPGPAVLQQLPEQVREVAESSYQLMLEGTRATVWNDAQLESFRAWAEEISDDVLSASAAAAGCGRRFRICERPCPTQTQERPILCLFDCIGEWIGCVVNSIFN